MRISPTSKPQIFVTMGDPSGIGPEVIMRSMASPELKGLAIFVIIGDADVIKSAFAPGCDVETAVRAAGEGEEEITLLEGLVNIVDPGPPLGDVEPGRPTDEGSKKALSCLDAALGLMRGSADGSPKALVTAPLSKERIARIHPGFIGHTEYLQQAYSAELVTMVMVGKNLCVVPVTRHIPLKDVASSLTSELIEGTLAQVVESRTLICGREDARIGVCALNPHSGEGGTIGAEEIDIITPAVEKAKKTYAGIKGPVSADVVFYRALKKEIDIVVSMYHDQGLAPFKMVDFDCGVNMTLGLGHVRTSPDHGTAFDIAGKGVASSGSMEQAIKLAVRS
ncbi:MAG: 4-hydroxythreonine-4-phosphate dehydrogenase PdxA, partial [Candidatus Omnitrophota bacterium]|nr:4-hydroxythreonine-4-phosphate dehydrogenase PdxA [Candidatus Omnitrophota bacterium]